MSLLLRRPGLSQLVGRHLRLCSKSNKLRYTQRTQSIFAFRVQNARFASTISTGISPRKTGLKNAQSERILSDPELQNRYIETLRKTQAFSPEDVTAISNLFNEAAEAATGEYASEAFRFVVKMWLTVFKSGDETLQQNLLRSRSLVANLCINNLEYDMFISCSAHVHGKPLWAETVARTLQFSTSGDGTLQFNIHGISTYLRGTSGINEKRQMIATFLRKALLYSRSGHDFAPILSAFIRFANDVGDGDLLLTAPKHSVYQKALSLLARPKGNSSVVSHIKLIQSVFMNSGYASIPSLANLLSSLMTAVVNSRPSVAHEYWLYKEEGLIHSASGYSSSEFLTSHDLSIAMWGLYLRREYKECLELYSKHPKLHHDDQIDVLLKISEETKDWRQLQKLFEDMYGRGDLPFVQHYAIVMNALASIKVVKEVDELFEQLLQRKLTPSCEIYAAVIRSRISVNDYDGAQEWFERFVGDYEKGLVAPGSVARVHALIFELHLHKSSLPDLMKALDEVLEKQDHCAVPLLDTKLFGALIKTVGANYGVRELDKLWDIAERFSMKTEEVYERMINALTRLGEYERADELTFEAHMESEVPFTSSLIAKAQLKNLRSWYNASIDREFKPYLSDKTMALLRRLDSGKFSLRDRGGLLAEAIKFELSLNRRKTARGYLDQAIALEVSDEQHYLPFLRYNCQAKSYKGASAVLELYREMAAKKIELTSSTYVYLLKALLEIDRTNSSNYINSYKLLESVFELYGLSMFEHIKPARASSENMQYHAENLLQIVSSYVATNTRDQTANMDLVVHFLNQMKDRLGSNVPHRFRLAIFKQMGYLYHITGDNETARKLALNALDHLFDVVDHFRSSMQVSSDFEVQVPKLLQLDFRQVVELIIPILRHLDSAPEEYERLAKAILQRNIHLAGPIFRTFIERMMKGVATESRIRTIFDICERYLVAGNWVEVNIEKKQQYIYKLFILLLSKRIPVQRILDNYDLFNQYYNVKSIDELKDEFKHLRHPSQKLQQALEEYGDLTSFRWNIPSLLKDPHKFFLPGRSISTRNVMDHRMTAKLYAYVGNYCVDDRTKAFKLYEDFPDTMEYLLYYGQARTRIHIFHNQIDEIQPPSASSAHEGRKNRRYRTFRALRGTMRLTSR